VPWKYRLSRQFFSGTGQTKKKGGPGGGGWRKTAEVKQDLTQMGVAVLGVQRN